MNWNCNFVFQYESNGEALASRLEAANQENESHRLVIQDLNDQLQDVKEELT